METKSTLPSPAYPPPLDRLLGLGALFTRGRGWRDYRQMGLGPGHVPDLLRMALNFAPPVRPETSGAAAAARRKEGKRRTAKRATRKRRK